MEDGRPSMTAFLMAALRAHHHLTAPEPRIFDDSLAMQLAGLPSPAEVRAFPERMADRLAPFGDRRAAEAKVRQMMLTTCARACFTEDRLAAALARGVEQMVILGAGLDSTAYRRRDLADRLRIFELDHPATQAWKRDRLAAIGVAPAPNLVFAPFDFERQSLAEALSAGGVRADAPTFVSWLGVLPYLTEDAVLSTLDAVAAFPSGSELVLDLLTPDGLRPGDAIEQGGRRLLADFGEPFRTAYAPEAFAGLLQARGFTEVDAVKIEDWLARNGARFHERYTTEPGRILLVSARRA